MIFDRFDKRFSEREIDTVLYRSVATATLDEVQGIIAAGADPNAPVYNDIHDDFYAIHCAALNPDINVLKYLVSVGADPCRRDYWARPPLAFAVRKNPVEFARYLVELGNEATYEDFDGGTAIAEAVLNPHIEVLDYVLGMGSDIDAGAMGAIPLEIALAEGNVDRVAYLIERGARIELVSELSIYRAPMANLRLLLERGFDPNSMDDFSEARIIDHLDPNRRALFEEFGGSVLNAEAEKYYLEYPDRMPDEDKSATTKGSPMSSRLSRGWSMGELQN